MRILEREFFKQRARRQRELAGRIPTISHFRRAVMYADGVKKLRAALTPVGRPADLQQRAEACVLQPDMPRAFVHGDLFGRNLLCSGHLVDLDNCGFYPGGYEFARMLGKRSEGAERFQRVAMCFFVMRGNSFGRLSMAWRWSPISSKQFRLCSGGADCFRKAERDGVHR